MIAAALLFVALASPRAEGAQEPRPGVAALKDAERVFALGNPEQARVLVEGAIAEMLSARPEAIDADDERALRDAGALAYKLRSMEPARIAWDAVRRYREKAVDAAGMELQNARGNLSWIGEQMGLVAEARALEEQILAALEKALAPEHDALQMARANLADTLLAQGEFARGRELFQAVADVRRAKLPAANPQRLRADLDLACGLMATDDGPAAERLCAEVLREAPADAAAIRVRAAADLVLVLAAGAGPASGRDRSALDAAIAGLGDELDAVGRQLAAREWRAAEIRTAETGPFVTLLASARFGFGVVNARDLPRTSLEIGLHVPKLEGPLAVYQRWERTRIQGTGADRRVLADERLAVLLLGGNTRAWMDLGPLSIARGVVKDWDEAARTGDARGQAATVARTLFAPVSRALGDPEVLRIVPVDVIWAVPLHALELRGEKGRTVTVEAVLAAPSASDPAASGPWCVLGDPAPTSAAARKTAAAAGPSDGGAASAFVSSLRPSTGDATAAWGRRMGVEPVRGEDASVARFGALSMSSAGIVLAAPLWSAPEGVPCVTTPRPIVPSSPLAAAMAREDVFGGSSPADLCGFLFADFAGEPGEDARVSAAPRAADLRASHASIARRLVVANAPPRADVVSRARDIEALARALVVAGWTDLCFATQPIRDVERVTLPADLEAAVPRASPVPAGAVSGPWLRVRAIH